MFPPNLVPQGFFLNLVSGAHVWHLGSGKEIAFSLEIKALETRLLSPPSPLPHFLPGCRWCLFDNPDRVPKEVPLSRKSEEETKH